MSVPSLLLKIRELHTLGPQGTNCSLAAHTWFAQRNQKGKVVLHPTLEEAVARMPLDGTAALMACIAYPQLHNLMFSNLGRLRLADCLIIATHDMVFAARDNGPVCSVSSHPAPQGLIPAGVQTVRLATSNAQAAADCAAGLADGCITTREAAAAHGLRVITNHGPIDMGFTVHVVCGAATEVPS